MASGDDGQERTEEATSKRMQDARDKGQIPRSRELNSTAIMLAASAAFLFYGEQVVSDLARIMRDNFTLSRATIHQSDVMISHLWQAITQSLSALTPFLLLMVVIAIGAPMALGGWSFSTQSLGVKWERMSPVKGLGRIFGWHGVMELVKALLKFVILAGVSTLLLWHFANNIIGLGVEPVAQGVVHGTQIVGWSLLGLSGVMVLIAAVDVPFQLWQYARQMRMSRQEIKQEYKETEGSPEIRNRIRTVQREMARRRMMAEVPKADVIVTNPTHYAVALRYDPKSMRAPLLLAKGRDVIAMQIRAVGGTHKVTTLSAPALARAIYYNTEINHPIPAGLYLAVAQVLAYVYQIKQRKTYSAAPVAMPDLPIPDELRHDE